MLESFAATTESGITLLRRGPLIVAAIVSLLSVIVVLVWLVAGAFALAGVGLSLAARASTRTGAVRASTLVSLGFGLAVGPAVYLLLAIVVRVAG